MFELHITKQWKPDNWIKTKRLFISGTDMYIVLLKSINIYRFLNARNDLIRSCLASHKTNNYYQVNIWTCTTYCSLIMKLVYSLIAELMSLSFKTYGDCRRSCAGTWMSNCDPCRKRKWQCDRHSYNVLDWNSRKRYIFD